MLQKSRVTILVKALPQPSKKYGETVCCAGVTADRKWKRLFPIRFRHLSSDTVFNRWNIVEFAYDLPKRDKRVESCHVYEDSLKVITQTKPSERAALLEPMMKGSAKDAAKQGHSLAIIRPMDTRFRYKKRTRSKLDALKKAYENAARQKSFFDKDLVALEPEPYEFSFEFRDDDGKHNYRCGDWEINAMFYRERKRTSEGAALQWLDHVFNDEYPQRGMAFALGNMASRPQTWQLLGVVRLDQSSQQELLV